MTTSRLSRFTNCCLLRWCNSGTDAERRLVRKGWKNVYLIEKNGRHEETRTPDLYRVKVAL
jgi:hypothetical protein